MITVYATSNPFDEDARVTFQAEPATIEELIFLLPDEIGQREKLLAVFVGDRRVEVKRDEWATCRVEDDDSVSFIVLPAFAEGVLLQALVSVLISAAVSVIGSLLFKPRLPGRDRDDESSPTYGWNRISTNRRAGQPIEVLYGEFRQGGTMLAEFIRSQPSPVSSTLFQMISFGWGELQDVAGVEEDTPPGTQLASNLLGGKIFINDNPIENIDGIRIQLRHGNNVQEPVLGFHEIRTPVATAGYELLSETTSDLQPGVATTFDTLNVYDGTNDVAHWDVYARTEDIITPIDAATVVFECPTGAYAQADNGDLLPVDFFHQVRYRELDAFDLPITSGGHAGDGWVRLPPGFGNAVTPSFAQQGAFKFDIQVPLYDPQTWVAPDVGKMGATGGAASDRFEAAAASASSTVVPVAVGDGIAMTVAFWVNLNNGDISSILTAPTGSYIMLMDAYKTGDEVGIQLAIIEQDGVWKLNVIQGNGSVAVGVNYEIDNMGGLAAWGNTWHHIAVVTPQDGSGSRTHLYLDGNEVAARNVMEAKWSDATLKIGGTDQALTPVAKKFDDVRIWQQALTPSQIQTLANHATAITFPLLATERSFWDFEVGGGVNNVAAEDQWWGDLSLIGSGGLSSVGGIVSVEGTNEPKRMKVRLEVVRVTQDTDNTRTQDTFKWNEYQRVLDEKLIYPRRGIMAIEADATEQLNGGRLDITSINKGQLVPVWDGVDKDNPSAPLIYSANPAWVMLDIATNRLYGGGTRYSVKDVVSDELKALADHCDDVVYDGFGVMSFEASGVSDILYDHTVVDSDGLTAGELEIRFDVSLGSLTPQWVAGQFIRLRDIATPDDSADIFVNLNTPDDSDGNGAGGYEIFDIFTTATYHVVKCYYRVFNPAPLTGLKEPWLNARPSSGGAAFLDDVLAFLNPGIAEGGERRFEFNGVFDQERGMWDAITEVLGVARAAPRRTGKKIKVRYSHPQDHIAIITPAVIKKGSFRIDYANVKERPNAYDMQLRDKRNLYKNKIVTVIDDIVNNAANLSEIRKQKDELIGVTSVGQASREGRHNVLVNRLIESSGEFITGPNALNLEVGDVIKIAGELIEHGEGGRLLQNGGGSIPDALDGRDDLSGADWPFTGLGVGSGGGVFGLGSGDTDPFGDNTNLAFDATVSAGVIQQTPSTTFGPGIYCVSVLAKSQSSSEESCRISILLPQGGQAWVSFDVGSGVIISESAGRPMESGGQIQAVGPLIGSHGWYLISVWFLTTIESGTTNPLTIRFHPAVKTTGEAIGATGHMSFSKPNLTAGRYPSHPDIDGGARALIIDHPITLVGTEVVDINSNTDVMEEGTIDTVLCPPGTYDAGDTLFLTSPLLNAIGLELGVERHTQYIVRLAAEALKAEVTGTTLTDGLAKIVKWVKYDEAVYTDRSEDQTVAATSDQFIDNPQIEGKTPGRVGIKSLKDLAVRRRPGIFETRLRVAWEPSGERLAKNVIWARVPSQASRWHELGAFSGQDSYAEVTVPSVSPGDLVEIAVQPVSFDGTRRRPEYCEILSHKIVGVAVVPDPISSSNVEVKGRTARYTWTLNDSDLNVSVEIRRGGWILGDRVVTSPPGSRVHGVTTDWVGSDFNTPSLYARTKNAAGFYSSVVLLAKAGDPDSQDPIAADVTAPSLEWNNFDGGGNWENGVPVALDPVIGAEFEQNGSGWLAWTGASSSTSETTVYTTQDTATYPSDLAAVEAREFYIDAYWVAEQRAPVERLDAGFDWDDPDLDRYEDQGIVSLLPGESEVILRLEMRVNVDGLSTGWTGWTEYQPGLYKIVNVQFRFVASRPSTDYNMELKEFHTRILAPEQSVEQRTPQRSYIEQELF